MAYFRETGRPDSGHVGNGTGGSNNGLIVGGVAGRSIVICDILVETGTGTLGEGSGGATPIILYFVAGATNLTSPVKVSKGASVYATGSSDITITYYFED